MVLLPLPGAPERNRTTFCWVPTKRCINRCGPNALIFEGVWRFSHYLAPPSGIEPPLLDRQSSRCPSLFRGHTKSSWPEPPLLDRQVGAGPRRKRGACSPWPSPSASLFVGHQSLAPANSFFPPCRRRPLLRHRSRFLRGPAPSRCPSLFRGHEKSAGD